MDLVSLLIQIVVGTIIVAPLLWLAGRALAGKEKAKFTDAIWIVVLGTVVGAIVNAFVDGLLAAGEEVRANDLPTAGGPPSGLDHRILRRSSAHRGQETRQDRKSPPQP